MTRRLRVLVLTHPDYLPPAPLEDLDARARHHCKTEVDLLTHLGALGHEVRLLGVAMELLPIRAALEEWQPHIVFNLLEEFHGEAMYDQNVVAYLELLRAHYTGCNPRGLTLARGKALSKKLLSYHRIRVPEFAVFPMHRKVRRPSRLQFPLIVKSLVEHASLGIARASLVESDEKLAERVTFVHQRLHTDAIAEQYIEGRELYAGVLGNERLQVFPTWELTFDNLPADAPRIATARVKHDPDYQEKRGIFQQPADLEDEAEAHVARTSKRIYRILELDGYARIDYRLTPDGRLYFLEANPNPELAELEEFSSAALHAGVAYPQLLQRIINLGLRR